MRLMLVALVSFLLLPMSGLAQKEFGFDNQKGSGQPYLSPEATVKRMKVADGFEVKLFAAEPMLTNPIAMTIDEKGRVWVIESFEYPRRTPAGKAPRDRIVILEDTNGDGLADKRTVFAEGKDFPVSKERTEKGLGAFDMASGLEVGYGGCFVGAPPYLYHLKDSDGDGKADKFEVLASGFGSQDTHETLNTFTWGPDGWLYGLHGVFTTSKVTTKPGESPIDMDAAVWRYQPRLKKFEIFAEGTSNPWGMDFNSQGDCFICCCVIPHLFHIVPAGIYIKQGDKPSNNPYAYGALKEICDHTFHKESGWAHAGLLCLDTPVMPEEYRSSVIFGSIHGCSIKRNVLKRNGSTYVASKAPDFLVSGDKNFRPINLRWGPGGDIYISDWHDQNPCHQTKPDDWDYERGRVYRVVRKGGARPATVDLSRKSTQEQLQISLESHDQWGKRQARRLLSEEEGILTDFGVRIDRVPLELFWVLMSQRDSVTSKQALVLEILDSTPRKSMKEEVLVWLIRILAEERPTSFRMNIKIRQLTEQEQSIRVRRELAYAVLNWGARRNSLVLLGDLSKSNNDLNDPVFPFMLWLAFEKQITRSPQASVQWLQQKAEGNAIITNHLIARAMRRLAATDKPDELTLALNFLGEVSDRAVRIAALNGLAEAFRGRQVAMPPEWTKVAAMLRGMNDNEIERLTYTLGASFGDPEVVKQALETYHDVKKPAKERIGAIQQLATIKAPAALSTLLSATKQEIDLVVRLEAARSLAVYDKPEIARDVLEGWKQYPQPVRAELILVLRSRKPWAKALLEAVGVGDVPRSDLNDNVALAIASFKDKELTALVEKVYGKFRESPAELAALLEKLKIEVPQGGGDTVKGKLAFEKHCMQCHQFAGRGHTVGPNLDGAERSLDYLLTNIVDPNRVVGTPYFSRTVLLKSGKIITGLLVEEDPKTIRLKRENDVIEVITKSEIEEQTTSSKSLMPEGLSGNMTVQELRDLVRYLEAKK